MITSEGFYGCCCAGGGSGSVTAHPGWSPETGWWCKLEKLARVFLNYWFFT